MMNFRPNEKIYLIKRRHQAILMRNLFPELIISFVAIIATIFLFFASPPALPDFLVNFLPSLSEFNFRFLLLYFFSLLFLVLWTIIFLTITNYYLDCWIVTNERTIHTELRGLFSRVTSSVNHDKIQDVTVDINGFLPTLLNFGNLHIQTAGEFREFVFRQIPNPYKTKEVIFKAQERLKETIEEKI
jgi:uncharacterized membrane protein YdbT with pleckstrin-like domain